MSDLIRTPHRRTLLKTALGGLAAAGLPPLAVAACGPKVDVAATELAPGLHLISGAPGNVVARATDQGLVLVDSGAPDAAGAIAGKLASLQKGAGVRTIFNTHYHLDQTGGNARLARGQAAIVAHAVTRQWLCTDYYVPAEDRWERARPKTAWPTETFYTTGALEAGEKIEYGHLLDAHTAGDAYVFFRDSNVLVAGDAVSPVRDPVIDWFAGGWIGGRADAQAKLVALADENTRIVPAYGPVMTKAELEAEAAMTMALFDKLNELIRLGKSAQDMLDLGALDETGRTWSDPYKFLYDASKSLWAHQVSLAPNIV